MVRQLRIRRAEPARRCSPSGDAGRTPRAAGSPAPKGPTGHHELKSRCPHSTIGSNALLGRVAAAEQIVGQAGPDMGNMRGGLIAGMTWE